MKTDRKNFTYYHAKALFRHFERYTEIYKRTGERSAIKSGIKTPQKGDSHFVESEYTSRHLTPSSEEEKESKSSYVAIPAPEEEHPILMAISKSRSNSDSSSKSSKSIKGKKLAEVLEEPIVEDNDLPEFPYFTLASAYQKVMGLIGKLRGNGADELLPLSPNEQQILESLSMEDINALKELGSNNALEKSFSVSSETLRSLKSV